MTNTKFLKKKLIDAGYDNFVKALADILHISRQTASRKLNGEVDFDQSELSILVRELDISSDELKENFVSGVEID